MDNRNGFRINLERAAEENNNYRKVLYTDKNTQLVLMSLEPQEFINWEKHDKNTQTIRVESGKARVSIGKRDYNLTVGDVVIVPPKKLHWVKNTSDTERLKISTFYSPKEHEEKLIQKYKPESD